MRKNNGILYILLTGVLALVGVLLYRKSSAVPSSPSDAIINFNESSKGQLRTNTELFAGGEFTEGTRAQSEITFMRDGQMDLKVDAATVERLKADGKIAIKEIEERTESPGWLDFKFKSPFKKINNQGRKPARSPHRL